MALSLRLITPKNAIVYCLLTLGLQIHLSAFADTKPYYITAIGDSITVGVDGNDNQQIKDQYTYSSAIIQGKNKVNQQYQTRFFGNTAFAPGGYREALIQLMCDPNLSINVAEQTINNNPATSIASHFQCNTSLKNISFIDKKNQLHLIKFLGNTHSNPLGGDPNNQAPGIDFFTATQAPDSNKKIKTINAPYFANQGYTLCDNTHNCQLPITSLFQQAKTPIPDQADIFTITLAGTNDIMIGFDTFDELKSDLLHFITSTLPMNFNPKNANNQLYHIVSPIPPVANSGACKMFTTDGCADITYNRYIQNENLSSSSPSLTQDVLLNNPNAHISIAQPIIPVTGYKNNVHPDIQNYLYLGYNIANALVKNFQMAASAE
ncbi:hypothetical protein [uncultured Shewanella sp.]|uniref:hypothetical protein n=1 Tax=uncultured Shewanella sp. TaxID=173975 RepID=UPI00260C2353|nr:hypothetical protein [uncultured Shewanella sp.]